MIQARSLASSIGNYSTSEVDTGFTWINGKHIYKKTINFGALPNATKKEVVHGISNLDYVIKIEGTCFRSSDKVTFQIGNAPNPTTSIENAITIVVYPNNVEITTGVNRSAFNAYITLYYTKN